MRYNSNNFFLYVRITETQTELQISFDVAIDDDGSKKEVIEPKLSFWYTHIAHHSVFLFENFIKNDFGFIKCAPTIFWC